MDNNPLPECRTVDDERMVPLELARELYGKVSPRYKLCFSRHEAAYEFVLKLLKPSYSVLDLGCGTGYGSSLLSNHCKNLTGIDYSQEAVQYASQHYGSEKLVFLNGEALDTGQPDDSFDLVCSVQVIEHLKEQELFIKEILRVLNPGGVFVAVTPNKATYSPESEVGFSYHYKEYRGAELLEFLSGYFSSVKMYGLFPKSVLARAYHDKYLARYSKGRLLSYMPRYVRKKVRKLIWHRHKNSPISSEDFLISDSMPIDEALDLVAVCRKGA